jgi:hypothetical protein
LLVRQQLLLRYRVIVRNFGATVPPKTFDLREKGMADRRIGGISMGGVIVILGIILIIVWSFWIGLIVTLIGLIAFGGFARGKWY